MSTPDLRLPRSHHHGPRDRAYTPAALTDLSVVPTRITLPPPLADSVVPTTMDPVTVTTLTPAPTGLSTTLSRVIPPLSLAGSVAPTTALAHATTLAPALNGLQTRALNDERLLYDDNSSGTSSGPAPSGFRADSVGQMQAEYRTLDVRQVPRIQFLRTMRDALSCICDYTDFPAWVPEWHVPLLTLTNSAIHANHDDTLDLHRLVDDMFAQL